MAPKYQIKTDVYQELWDLLKEASLSESPGGGKRMSREMWLFLMKEIVDGDLELDAIRAEAGRIRQRVSEVETLSAENHSQLSKMAIELVQIEIASEVNRMTKLDVVQRGDSLTQMIVYRYID